MKIDQQTRLIEIQKAFNKKFPYLRIEFYKKAHEPGEGTADRERLNHDKKLNEVTKTTQIHDLNFDGKMQVSALESMLDVEFGLHAQVFRRSGNLWLQTTATDGWTLDQANRKGGHSEELIEEEPEQEEPEEREDQD